MSESATVIEAEPAAASNGADTPSNSDVVVIDELRSTYDRMRSEMAKVIIGQDEVVERLLICILSRGHALLMGVPGLAKTLMVNSLSKVMSLDFNRIQFTPDLMPSDITGTDILQETAEGRREFEFVKGPIFANIILADEINRTPPKTQSALLEAMQEHHVTVAGRIMPLPEPFFVLATQNPIEQEGTYSLPEAQLDRFMFFIEVDYPNRDEERRIARETTGTAAREITPQVSGEQILKYQKLVERVPVPDHIYDLAVDIVRATRPASDDAPVEPPDVVAGDVVSVLGELDAGTSVRAAVVAGDAALHRETREQRLAHEPPDDVGLDQRLRAWLRHWRRGIGRAADRR